MKNTIAVQEKRRQEEILQTFFKEINTNNAFDWFIVILMEIIAGILMCIPYQEAEAMEISVFIAMIAFLGVRMYVEGYVQLIEKRKVRFVYDKIKYLPISRSVLIRWRMKKLCTFCGKTTLIFVGLQLLFTWVSSGTVSMDNILYPVIMGVAIPVSVLGYLCCTK